MDSSTLFEDVFEVKEANPDGKFFDKGASSEHASGALRPVLRRMVSLSFSRYWPITIRGGSIHIGPYAESQGTLCTIMVSA